MDVLTKILDEMKRQKISQKTITSSLGLSKQSFSEWKAGRVTSYMKYLPQIAQILGVSVDYLLGSTDDPTPPAERDPGIKKAPLPEVDPETGLDDERRALLAIYDSLSDEKRAMMLETAQAFRAKEEAERKTEH